MLGETLICYVMAIDIWMSLCMAYVFAAVVEYAVANFIQECRFKLLKKSHKWKGIEQLYDRESNRL